MSSECEIVERPNQLVIRVRWLPRIRGIVMLAVLIPFLGMLILVTDNKVGIAVLSLILTYPALLFALNRYCLTVTPDEVRTSCGPVPFFFGRRRLSPSDIQDVSSLKVQAVSARGGVIERYTLQVHTRSGRKAIALLDGEREADIRAAAEVLVGWLNANRARDLEPVWLG